MNKTFARAATALAAGLAVTAAWAGDFPPDTAPSGAHYASRSSEPICTLSDDKETVTCTGTEIGGVGNTNGDVSLSISSSQTIQCTNNGGQVVEVKSTLQSDTSPKNATELRNGTLYVDAIVGTVPTSADLAAKARCPNKNWTKTPLGSLTLSWTYTLTFRGFTLPAIVVTSS
jgi:hypothetical protein